MNATPHHHYLFGRFDDITSNEPTYDPGLEVPCLFCFKPLLEQVRKTITFYVPGDDKVYFYRCHRSCYESMSEQEVGDYEGTIIDQVFDAKPELAVNNKDLMFQTFARLAGNHDLHQR